jgi:hypothetical protein
VARLRRVALPKSARTRRRLGYAAIAAAIVLAAVVAQLVIGTSHGPPTLKTRAGAPQIVREPKHVAASAADRAAAERTLRAFVPSAFVRRNLARSWPLATAHMKIGTSHADWLAGNLPVVPYPATQYRTASFTLKYSYRNVLGYDVLVLPKRAGGMQEVYSCELHDVGGRWLVDFCYPRKTL